jgi:hypothetical protein
MPIALRIFPDRTEARTVFAIFRAGLDMYVHVRPGKFDPDIMFDVVGKVMGLLHREVPGHADMEVDEPVRP